jgi:hypothetical protein
VMAGPMPRTRRPDVEPAAGERERNARQW